MLTELPFAAAAARNATSDSSNKTNRPAAKVRADCRGTDLQAKFNSCIYVGVIPTGLPASTEPTLITNIVRYGKFELRNIMFYSLY
jgi:hypothetical protein